MPEDRRTDLLLTVSRHALRFAIAVMGIIIAIGLWALTALLLFPSRHIAAQLAAAPDITLPIVFLSAGIGVFMLVLSMRFAMELGRIVRTVQEGDPFEPANATRLARMGWLALWVTVAGWVLVPLASWLARYFEELSVNGGTSLPGLALAVTLFILARVFRHGAAMREDLEGTV